MRVLILGGTSEARQLAEALVQAGYHVTSSLAGRVTNPALPPGAVRIGGFGGVGGLGSYLHGQRMMAVIDATHPFAAVISAHAAQAATLTGTPLLRLERPGWAEHPRAGAWRWVPDTDAARAAAESSRRPFLTTGRQSLDRFRSWAGRQVLVRLVEPPTEALPPAWTVIRSRGPYRYVDEFRILRTHDVDVLVTKDSGGSLTSAKLDAAADLGIPVVVIERPPPAPGVDVVGSVADAVTWVMQNCRIPPELHQPPPGSA